jgi:hypothetical protein
MPNIVFKERNMFMIKISSAILLSATFATLSFAQTAPATTVTATTATKDQGHQGSLAKAPRDKAYYLGKLDKKIADTEKFVADHSKATAEQKAEAAMKLSVAKKWRVAINNYKGSDTRFARSSTFCSGELLSARRALDSKKFDKKFNAKHMENLTSHFEAAKKDGAALTDDNKIAFDTMIDSAKMYIDFLDANKEKALNFKNIMQRGKKYLDSAQSFAKHGHLDSIKRSHGRKHDAAPAATTTNVTEAPKS